MSNGIDVDLLLGRLRGLLDDVLVPAMRARTITVDIEPTAFQRALDRRVVVRISPGPEAGDAAALLRSISFEFSKALTAELQPLGEVDLSQQRMENGRCLTINFFTDTPQNEFLARLRSTNAALGRGSVRSR